jgi:Ca2+/Na+ antiporter
MARLTERYSRRSIALFWLALVTIVIFTLIAFEQIAVLYILLTLSLVVLLLVVGFADLEKVSRDKIEGFAPKSD